MCKIVLKSVACIFHKWGIHIVHAWPGSGSAACTLQAQAQQREGSWSGARSCSGVQKAQAGIYTALLFCR